MTKPTVFISYCHADSGPVDWLADELEAGGVDVWIDKWKIKVGDSITERINEGITASDFLIVVLSRSSVNSRWVKEELNAATVKKIEEEKHAFILPVLLEDCEIPALLRDKKYANFADDPQQAFRELLDVILPSPPLSRLPSDVEGYCVKCRAKRVMKDAKEVTMKNGRMAAKGTCPECGSGMFKFLPKNQID